MAGREAHDPQPVGAEFIRRLASLRLTILLLVALAAASLASLYWPAVRSPAIAVSCGLLAVNLLAAIVHVPALRRFRALLVFHLALLALVVLAGLSALTSMYGTAEISEGQSFDRHFLFTAAGPWHPQKDGLLVFSLDRVDFSFQADGSVKALSAGLVLPGVDGVGHRYPLSIQQPVQIAGVRIYPAPARGFAAVMTWWPSARPESVTGALHFPPQPADPYSQVLEWVPPEANNSLWLQVNPQAVAEAKEAPDGRLAPDARLTVRDARGQRLVLGVGDSVALDEGRLRLDRFVWWIGLSFHYDWTIPWLLATAGLAVLSLGAHFFFKYRRVSWDA